MNQTEYAAVFEEIRKELDFVIRQETDWELSQASRVEALSNVCTLIWATLLSGDHCEYRRRIVHLAALAAAAVIALNRNRNP